jgi:adenylosuccinate synthase
MADAIATCRGMENARAEIGYLEDPETADVWISMLRPFLPRARILSEDDVRARTLQHQDIVFEGAQGALLDEWRGFHPYTTWSTTTFDNAFDLLDDWGWDGDILKMGVIRGYATRHGAGPFPTEDADMSKLLPDSDNVTNDWQREFRVGWLDLVAIRYAIRACEGIDALAVTCLDRLKPFKAWMACDAYETAGGEVRDLPLGRHRDLEHQEKLTSLLSGAVPKFMTTTHRDDFDRKAVEHAVAINTLLGDAADGLMISTGPTRDDKSIVY